MNECLPSGSHLVPLNVQDWVVARIRKHGSCRPIQDIPDGTVTAWKPPFVKA